MHLVYTFSFVVVLVTLIATLSSSSVSLELVYRLQHIKAWLDPPVSSLPRRLLQFPNHWSTFRNAFPLSCPSCESCWYENHSFHPLLFENVSILQKSINYCHQNTLSLQWLKNNSRPSRSSKFLSNHHEYWVTWHSNSGEKLDFLYEKWDIYFRYDPLCIIKQLSSETGRMKGSFHLWKMELKREEGHQICTAMVKSHSMFQLFYWSLLL